MEDWKLLEFHGTFFQVEALPLLTAAPPGEKMPQNTHIFVPQNEGLTTCFLPFNFKDFQFQTFVLGVNTLVVRGPVFCTLREPWTE